MPNVLGLMYHFCVSFLVELGLIRFSFVFSLKTWTPFCCSWVVTLNMFGLVILLGSNLATTWVLLNENFKSLLLSGLHHC